MEAATIRLEVLLLFPKAKFVDLAAERVKCFAVVLVHFFGSFWRGLGSRPIRWLRDSSLRVHLVYYAVYLVQRSCLCRSFVTKACISINGMNQRGHSGVLDVDEWKERFDVKNTHTMKYEILLLLYRTSYIVLLSVNCTWYQVIVAVFSDYFQYYWLYVTYTWYE